MRGGGAVLTRYVVTDKDAAGPFDKLPAELEARRQLKAMPYESLDEALPESKPGGRTIHHFDNASEFAYYYAHFDSYAEGLREGMHVRKGQLMGYVGSTGNAAPEVPHLISQFFVWAQSGSGGAAPLSIRLAFGTSVRAEAPHARLRDELPRHYTRLACRRPAWQQDRGQREIRTIFLMSS